jgi:hypothetical protein
VTKVAKLWSWILEKIRGSESSQKIGPPYRDLPQIPAPKPRAKARYSLVLISEAGHSQQFELTPLRVRIGLAGLAVIAIVIASALVMGAKSGKARVSQDPELQTKLEAMREELRVKEAALSVQEKRVKELEEAASEAPGGQKVAEEPERAQANPEPEVTDDSRGEFQEASKPNQRIAAGAQVAEEESESRKGSFQLHPGPTRPLGGADVGMPSSSESTSSAGKQSSVNFDAQEVTATADLANKGILSFRLVKDQPETAFSGYLFVFVEMVDQRGEPTIYVYPKQAHLGEEDLPTDYRQGENMAFKRNSRVELPYKDTRQDAHLARVIILLYGDSGKIVFQRDFGPKELKMVSSKPSPQESSTRTKSGDRRRAL